MSMADVPLPWDQLVAEASAPERKMLLEMRRIHDGGGPVGDAAERRLLELRDRLAATGTWERLGALAEEYRAKVKTLIVMSPTPTDTEEE